MTLALIVSFVSWFIGGFTSGVAGFGAMMVALPILALGMTMTDAVLTCCIIGLPSCTHLAWLYRKNAVWSELKWLWAGCIPGGILGALALKAIPMRDLQIAISLMIMAFLVLQAIQSKVTWTLKDSIASLIITGMASGFANSSVSVVGVPIGIFVLLKHWDKDHARSTTSNLFMFSSWVTFASQYMNGLYTDDLLLWSIPGIISSFLGQYLGFLVGRHINQKLFIAFVLVFLSLAAVILFSKAVF